ncbi:MAG: hypothetical protein GX211_08100 [Clostridiaceae bacterium]|nr:hypothetical protein [Clostridiaceae bacterium]
METKTERRLTLKTASGCRMLLAISIAIILLFSCIAHLLTSDGGTVKVSLVKIDARGATMDGELYYPVGTTDEDSLPAVIVTHGAGVTHIVTRGLAQELARRGFVVLNLSAYGAGLSEFPQRDEIGMGEENYNARTTPGGLHDAVDFLRTFEFVDQTRIGISGHSQGHRRASMATAIDCGYLTFNDIMINVLYETFGISFTEEEITQNADELAAKRLNSDQLEHYNTIKAQKREDYDTRIKSLCMLGGNAPLISPLQTVNVAGYEVKRNCQTNFGIIIGDFDFGYATYVSDESTMESYYTDTPLDERIWYSIDDYGKKSTALGNIYDMNVTRDAALADAISNRTARIFMTNAETHSRNFFSSKTAADFVKYFEQTLSYNRGELTDPATKPLDARNIIFIWREVFNGIAMLAMLFMLIPLACLFLKSKFFAPCVGSYENSTAGGINKKTYWVFNIVTVIISFIAIYISCDMETPFLPFWKFFPIWTAWYHAPVYLAIMAGGSVLILLYFWFTGKKKNDLSGFKALNVTIKAVNVFKTILLSVILLALAYLSLVFIEYVFLEEYQFFTAYFTAMKVEYWGYIWRLAILVFPLLLLVGATTNYTIRKDIAEWKDTLISVIAGSLGVWLCWLINYIVLHSGAPQAFVNWNSTYAMLILVPVITYLNRKLYKISNSIWLGAALNSLLIAWTTISSMGYHTYVPQSFFSNFFGL